MLSLVTLLKQTHKFIRPVTSLLRGNLQNLSPKDIQIYNQARFSWLQTKSLEELCLQKDKERK